MKWMVLGCAALVAGSQTLRPRTTDRFRVRVSPLWTKDANLARSSWRNLTASVRARALTPGAWKARQCTTALNGSPDSQRSLGQLQASH